jgi:hypothetical protein
VWTAFRERVLPELLAMGNIHIGTIIGKFQRRDSGGRPSEWLLSGCGAAVANSSTSIQRCTSPKASRLSPPGYASYFDRDEFVRARLRPSTSLRSRFIPALLSLRTAGYSGEAVRRRECQSTPIER